MNKPYFCPNFVLTDWRHKRLKNTNDLLLFYGEPFYGLSESELIKTYWKSENFKVIGLAVFQQSRKL